MPNPLGLRQGRGLLPLLEPSSSGPVFNPATLALSMWHSAKLAAYSAPPWAGNASAGGSGSVTAGTAGADPTVGAALNGHNTTAFNGTSELLSESVGAATLFTANAGTFCCLFNASSIPTSTGANYTDGNMLADPGNADQGFGLTSNGLGTVLLNSAASNYDQLYLPFSTTGSWHLFQSKWTNTGIRARVDSGAWSSVTTTGSGFAGASANMYMGVSYASTQHFAGLIAEMMTAAVTLSDSDCDNIKSYVNATYGLSL